MSLSAYQFRLLTELAATIEEVVDSKVELALTKRDVEAEGGGDPHYVDRRIEQASERVTRASASLKRSLDVIAVGLG